MRLVPKQLQRAGMTGSVPYYGGRFTPAQAYAAAHPSTYPPGSSLPAPESTGAAPAARPSAPPASRAGSQADTLAALQHLVDTGVITAKEFEEIRGRVVP